MTSESVKNTSPEIVVGLVGALGTELARVEAHLEASFHKFEYEFVPIKISDLIKQHKSYADLDRTKMGLREYYDKAIDAGNTICAGFKSNRALACWAIKEISEQRKTLEQKKAGCRRVYVIHSLKRRDEVLQLRETYGSLFYCLAVYADETMREDRLTRSFKEHSDRVPSTLVSKDPHAEARHLIRTDHQQGLKWGQDVRNTFVEADYFVRSDAETDLPQAIDRFTSLILDVPYISPTKSEVAMMHAMSAALRSADLSRQVGAAIASRDGRLLSTGCNEVPRAGGGQYWEEDRDDQRDSKLGYDANDKKKKEAIIELLDRLNESLIPEELDDGVEALYLSLQENGRFEGTTIDSLLEFGRTVHAESAAIVSAGIEPVRVRDCDLYCTTLPCHMCTRLIIAAGIRNVFYIEPYPKSAALELYKDSIEVNPLLSRLDHDNRLTADSPSDRKVYFIPFEGVAPRRYDDLFRNSNRKDKKTGNAVRYNYRSATPRQQPAIQTHIFLEEAVLETIGPQIDLAINKGLFDTT